MNKYINRSCLYTGASISFFMGGKYQFGRVATVYLPEKSFLTEWQNEAKAGGASISQYVFEMVERARRPVEPLPRQDLVHELAEARQQVSLLDQECSNLRRTLENAQTEIYKLRFSSFDRPVDSPGFGEYDSALVGLLKRGRVLDSREILAGLGIDHRDSQAVKLVTNQLEELRRFGLVEESSFGWRWV